MHERQIGIVLGMLMLSILFTTESFADTPKCNGIDATIVGTNNKEKIYGTSGDDIIAALEGNDIIFGKSGNDIICGGAGNDVLYGNSGNDILIGEGNLDVLDGGNGVDMCDSSLDDKRVRSCETQFKESHGNVEDLQKQINALHGMINDIILRITSWDEIEGMPEDIADGDNDALGEISCSSDQILVFDGTSWICENNNLALECTNEQILKFDGEKWGCSDLPNIDFSDTLSELNCVDEEIPKKSGNKWACSIDQNDAADTNKASSAIFFHFAFLRGGQTEWVGTSTQTYDSSKIDEVSMVMPTSGTLSNLFAKKGTSLAPSPSSGISYKLTVLVNGLETTPALSCIMVDNAGSCSDKVNQVFVNEGDVVLLKIEAMGSAPFAIISSSVLLT